MSAVIGVFGHSEASTIVYLGLYAQQHRGPSSAGAASSDGKELYLVTDMGWASKVFTRERLTQLPGALAIGYNRNRLSGALRSRYVQPIVTDSVYGRLAIVFSGNMVDARSVRSELNNSGSVFWSDTSAEIILHLLARSRRNSLIDGLTEALSRVRGAYSLLLMTSSEIIAVRDPYGFWPLCLGELDGGFIIASEVCALDLVDAVFMRNIAPGEFVRISENGLESAYPFSCVTPCPCLFELVSFSRPDNEMFSDVMYSVRKELGCQLAREAPAEADIVIPVPDNNNPMALGFSEESNIPFDMGLIRNHYVSPDFVEPVHSIRHFGLKIKLSPVRALLAGKRVVVIDDMIVKGETVPKLVHILRSAGAREVHIRIGSPPVKYPCLYDNGTSMRGELIAAMHSAREIGGMAHADSLAYLSLKSVMRVCREDRRLSSAFCTACFTGEYPAEPVVRNL
jgi:amidophosphoribosyltransferase